MNNLQRVQGTICNPRKQHKILHYENFRFQKDKENNNKQYWKCVEYKNHCKARIHRENEVIVKVIGDHNHAPPEPEVIQEDVIINDLRIAAANNFTLSANNIFNNVTSNCLQPHNIAFRNVKCLIYTTKTYFMPPVPHNKAEILTTGEWSLTRRGERFILPAPDNEMIIFATDENIRTLGNCNIWLMDGTFKCVPTLYLQLYTIHGIQNGFCIPLVYALLCSKNAITYKIFFRRIINYARMLGIILQPLCIKSDCESGIINALQTIFPNVEHQLCYFHFCQSNYRYATNNCKLAIPYRNNYAVRQLIRKYSALAFLPLLVVRIAFNNLATEIHSVDVAYRRQLLQFADYFQRQWIDGFINMRMWNVHNVLIRTNNLSEGWHSRWNKLVGRSHPNYYQFVIFLRIEQSNSESLIFQALNGQQAPPRSRKYRLKEERLIALLRRYRNPTAVDQATNNVITAERLLRAISHMI